MTPLKRTHQPKIFVIGLDGATFNLIKPWASAGHLPTLKHLLDQGVHADLASTIPPVTAPAWTSFMTGKNPGKHGLYHFIEPQPGGYEVRYTNARSRLAKSIWGLMSDAGMSVGVINVPMTYPPELVNGYMISGMDSPEGSTGITYPPDLYREIEEVFGQVSPQIRYLGFLKTDQRREAVLQGLAEMDAHYVRMTKYLMKRRAVDVAMVVFTSVDTVQHFFWHYMDPNHPQHEPDGAAKYGQAIRTVYQRIDDIIAQLTADLPEDTVVVLMSDHGFHATSGRIIHLNRYLQEQSLLSLYEESQQWYHPKALMRTVIQRADGVLRSTLAPSQKARISRVLPELRKKWESHYSGMTNIDWGRTKAYCYEILTFPPCIWVNLKGLRPHGTVSPGAEYAELIQFMTERLYDLQDPVSGKQLISRIYHKDEIYRGRYLEQAPDLTLAWWDGITLLGKASFSQNGSEPVVAYAGGKSIGAGEWGGTHALHGILILQGKPFLEGEKLEQAEIIDVAPTLLHLLGLPIPEDVDGRVLHEAFKEAYTTAHSVSPRRTEVPDGEDYLSTSTYSDEEAMKVEERLRGLGYIE